MQAAAPWGQILRWCEWVWLAGINEAVPTLRAQPGLRCCWMDGISSVVKALQSEGSFSHPLSRFKWDAGGNHGRSWDSCWMTPGVSVSETAFNIVVLNAAMNFWVYMESSRLIGNAEGLQHLLTEGQKGLISYFGSEYIIPPCPSALPAVGSQHLFTPPPWWLLSDKDVGCPMCLIINKKSTKGWLMPRN